MLLTQNGPQISANITIIIDSADGNGPTGIAVDGSGNLHVTDANNHAIRKVTPAGVVTTLAGWAGMWGSSDGTGSAAQFYYPAGVTVSPLGYVYVADTGNNTLRSQAIGPSILTQPLSQTILTGATATLDVSIYGSTPLTYTWNYNGSNYAPSSSSALLASIYVITLPLNYNDKEILH